MMIACCGTLSSKVPCNQSHSVNPLDQFEPISSASFEWWMPCSRGVTVDLRDLRPSQAGQDDTGPYQSPMEDAEVHFHEWLHTRLDR